MLSRGSASGAAARIATLLACLAAGSIPALAAPVLEQVVLVQRHGVRPPIQAPSVLETWASRPWPAWPVGPGKLTDKGAEVVALVADAIRARYVEAGLLPAQGCPGEALVVWADVKDERTRRSGAVLADHLAPGCKAASTHAPQGVTDPVFHGAVGACAFEAEETRRAIIADLGPGGEVLDAASAAAVRSVFELLRPGEPQAARHPSRFKVAPHEIVLEGPLEVAAESAEIFLLEYAQGMPLADVAWGRVSDPAALVPLMASRDRQAWIAWQTPAVARHAGSAMARLMLGTLAGESRASAPAVGPGVKLLALAGHDMNLANMAGVFGVDWSLPGQPDKLAPATAFALERWRDTDTGAVRLSLSLFYAELDGMRVLDPAKVHRVSVPLPDCDGTPACSVQSVRSRVLSRIPAACGG